MGHKANPIGLRIGVKRTPDLVWSTPVPSARSAAQTLLEDFRVRERIQKFLRSLSLHSARCITQRTKAGWLVWVFYSASEGLPSHSSSRRISRGEKFAKGGRKLKKSDILQVCGHGDGREGNANASPALSLLQSYANGQTHLLSSLSHATHFASHTINAELAKKKGKGLEGVSSTLSFPSLPFAPAQGVSSSLSRFSSSSHTKNISFRWVSLPSPDLSAETLSSVVRSSIERGQRLPRIFSLVEAFYEANPSIRGIRILCSGRINGVEMAQDQKRQYGETSLHTLSHAIDYSSCTASTAYGQIGVKIWISYMI